MRADKKNVLYVVEDEESAQFRYRVSNLKELFDGDERWNIDYKLTNRLSEKDNVRRADLIIIERQSSKNNKISRLIKEAHRSNKKVVFDLDDLVFDYRDLFVLMKSTNSKNILYWIGYFCGIRRIAKKVDGFICTNEFLAKRLRRSFNKPVKVIRNSLNKKQIQLSRELIQKKKNNTTERFMVGYFSGSPTHTKDFRMVEPALIRFLDGHKNARLRVVGYMNFSGQMKKLIDDGKVEVMKPVDYLKLQELIASVDINIAPLVINDFTNCKSELKFFEAGIVETATIASPTYTFKRAIVNGKNGFLAQSEEWYDKLEYLYARPEVNKKIALAAKEFALEHYYGCELIKEVEEAYECFAQ